MSRGRQACTGQGGRKKKPRDPVVVEARVRNSLRSEGMIIVAHVPEWNIFLRLAWVETSFLSF